MLKEEIDLDWEMIEMADMVCRPVMKDFESKDRRLVFEGIVIECVCFSGEASCMSKAVLCCFPLLTWAVVSSSVMCGCRDKRCFFFPFKCMCMLFSDSKNMVKSWSERTN